MCSFLTLFCLNLSLSLLEITLLFIGVLACLDGYMNIAMEQTEEYVDGQLTSKYGDCFIRGNNGKQCDVTTNENLIHFTFTHLFPLYLPTCIEKVLYIASQRR